MPDFRFLQVFNDARWAGYAGSKTRIGRASLPLFPSETLSDRFIRELARERALPIKEIVEAFEFFAVVRKYVRTRVVVDLCAGHGLAGLLWLMLQRETEQVVLCDRRKPANFEAVLRAAERVAPWVRERMRYLETSLAKARPGLEPASGVIGVHSCGSLTETCLDIAAELRGPVAVLPCCRDHSSSGAPTALRRALGEDVAYDVHRTYAMEARGYRMLWREIPVEITPMNRVLIGLPRKAGKPAPERDVVSAAREA